MLLLEVGPSIYLILIVTRIKWSSSLDRLKELAEGLLLRVPDMVPLIPQIRLITGASLVLHHLGDAATTTDVESLKKEITSLGRTAVIVGGDIGEPATATEIVNAAVKAFGRIDVLISNAGICPFHAFLSMPHTLWHTVQQVNLNGAFYIVQAVANQMQAQTPQGGSIVAISSISALVGGALQSHYTPTKAGLVSLMQSCAIALGKYKIRCNTVLPGTIETAINEEDLSDVEKRKYMEGRTCLGRLGRPEDLGGPGNTDPKIGLTFSGVLGKRRAEWICHRGLAPRRRRYRTFGFMI
jgi:L-rhamnose 1-dehydrogenase